MGTVSTDPQIQSVVLSLLWFVIIIIFGGALYAFIMAIFQFIFSRGEEEKIKKAWNNIRYMIIGIMLSIFLLFGVPLLLERFEVPGYEEYTFQNIVQQGSKNFGVILESLDFLDDDWSDTGSGQDIDDLEQDDGHDGGRYSL